MPGLRIARSDACRAAGRVALAAAAATWLLGAAPAGAVLYKWVDANGRVTYSDQPPAGNVKAEIVGAPAPPSEPAAIRELANQEAELKKLQTQRAEEQKKAVKTRTEQLQLQQDCADARARLRIYESDQPIGRINEKGEQVLLDEAARLRGRERLETQIRERCPG